MNFLQVVLLGAVAGFTIYLGLPVGRIQVLGDRVRSFLAMISAGILLFLLIDIFGNLSQPIAEALRQASARKADYAPFLELAAISVAGLGVGLIGLTLFEQRFMRPSTVVDPSKSPARLALMIATGLGLHNFSEGLAIGQSAGRGAVTFAALLIIGFGLHNATEGFGIVGPLVGRKPSWSFLGLAGLIGGGPTFLGTIAGYFLLSTPLSVLFLSLAAGAILYILGELFHVARRNGAKLQIGWGLFVGFVFAYLTDLVLIAAGI
jgi:ZIP family zinc transporter